MFDVQCHVASAQHDGSMSWREMAVFLDGVAKCERAGKGCPRSADKLAEEDL